MKETTRLFGFIAVLTVIGLILTGCASLDRVFNPVNISVSHNLSSVRVGGTLAFRATGRNIIWSVSSTIDGAGSVAEGTFIDSSGELRVSSNETAATLYVRAISTQNNLTDYRRIRVVTVTGVTVDPAGQSVAIGRTLQFRASVAGNNNPDNVVTWRVSANADGTGAVSSETIISANGMLTVSANETLTILHVLVTSVVDPSISGSAPVNIVVPTVTNVAVSSSNQSVRVRETLQFMAEVTGTYDPDSAVTWRVSSNAAGTGVVTPGTSMNANGVLTVAANETLPTLFVIATSVYDPTKSGSAPVAVIIPTVTSVTVSPSNQTVSAGGTFQFNAQLTGTYDPDSTLTWGVSSNAAGTGAVTPGTSINANGLLTVSANETARTLFVFATSVFDPTRFGSSMITVILNTTVENEPGAGGRRR
jgi:hypothetical protein